MPGRADLSLSETDERCAAELESEIEDHFADGTTRPYELDPGSVTTEYTERVKREVMRRARKAGLKVDLDEHGRLTVQRP